MHSVRFPTQRCRARSLIRERVASAQSVHRRHLTDSRLNSQVWLGAEFFVTVSFSQSLALFPDTTLYDQKQPEKFSSVQQGPSKLCNGKPALIRFLHILGPESIENAQKGKYAAKINSLDVFACKLRVSGI
jgi:hypothetical protein